MKIGVISDTHIHRPDDEFPKQLIEGLTGVDLILHAGDLVDISVLNRLQKIARVIAVHGNMDSNAVRGTLLEQEIISVEKIKIGLVHGWGPPMGLIDRVKEVFLTKNVDVIIYGHSHIAATKQLDNILFINPGSPTDKIFAPYNSYAILNIEGRQIDAKIIKL